jgi:hypothetical protein
MKRLLIPLLVLCMIALAVPAFAQVELGMSWTPVPGGQGSSVDSITGFHVAYRWTVLYLSWDSLVMPPVLIQNMTGYWDPNKQQYVSGPYLPGFLNLYDVGLELMLRPFVIYAEVGTNTIYVYNANPAGGGFGANLRLGGGLTFGWWGLNLSGTAVFPTFAAMTETLKKLASSETRDAALKQIGDNITPSINLTFYF